MIRRAGSLDPPSDCGVLQQEESRDLNSEGTERDGKIEHECFDLNAFCLLSCACLSCKEVEDRIASVATRRIVRHAAGIGINVADTAVATCRSLLVRSSFSTHAVLTVRIFEI